MVTPTPFAAFLAAGCCLAALASSRPASGRVLVAGDRGSSGCLACHEGIEPMHPAAELSCVDCHGGDASARQKSDAHVPRRRSVVDDESVAGPSEDLAWRRFRNPMDLRVVELTCGTCHGDLVDHLALSLHGTTAGHLSDGYYEVGLLERKGSVWSIFDVPSRAARDGAVGALRQVPAFRANLPADELGAHYSDLARKECMQCHLYSQGRALRGRVGFDGDYRGEGCAACHVPYGLGGFSASADRSATRTEPGHPRRHEMTRAPDTQACTSCHYGDASIGLHFRGLSQLPPGAPGGPEIPGTTDAPLNRVFYLDDPQICPPDVHYERGMHCIDCHTLGDVMGDGALHGNMEHAVEISCEACHGTFMRPSDLRTERGTPLVHLRREGERVLLTGKVTGAQHVVPQVAHLLDPTRAEFNARAAEAMRPEHEGLECYTCHAGWNVNFLGFHFYRDETLSQLDLLGGRRTPGRVTTQEKVFTTWKSFYAGRNEKGRVAPYMTGFATMGSVTDAAGERVLDQVLPVTAAGLSGMTMIHHQTHSTRPTARACVECHRSPATWGLGSVNYRLARQLAFVADRRGIEVVALNRARLSSSLPLAKIVLPDVIDVAILADPLQGFAQYLFVAEGGRGVHVIDVRDPAHPARAGFVATIAPRGLALSGDHLYVADGPGGLRVFDLTRPSRPVLVGSAATFDAEAVSVQWPWAYVADGPGGLAIVDVRAPIAPRVVSAVRLGPEPGDQDVSIGAALLFQYSRPQARDGRPVDRRTPARNLCAVLDENAGLRLVDVTEPRRPELLHPRPGGRGTRPRDDLIYRGLALATHVDLAEQQGGTSTREADYAYLLAERRIADGQRRSTLVVLDVTDPERPRQVGRGEAGYATEMLAPAAFYNPPFLQNVMFAAGELGVAAIDVSVSAEPDSLGSLPGLPGAYALAIEEFALDEMRDPSGRPLKDVSHEGSRWLNLAEIERVLTVSGRDLGLLADGDEPPLLGGTARLAFARLDRDRSGFLEGDEVPAAMGEEVAGGDGRVSLLELAGFGGTFERSRSEVLEGNAPRLRAARVDRDGDLARLLDGVDPHAFDQDGDGRLSRRETERAFLAALDLDRSGSLDRDELSRYPGELRQLRYGDRAAQQLFRAEDRNGDGKVGAREFRVRDEEWDALDVDRDGTVVLPRRVSAGQRRRGDLPPAPEWPVRRAEVLNLPPLLSAEELLARFDADGDLRLSARELAGRGDILAQLDANDSGLVEPNEVARAVRTIAQLGVEATADAFELRWDLDGDERVTAAELPLPPWLRARILGAREGR